MDSFVFIGIQEVASLSCLIKKKQKIKAVNFFRENYGRLFLQNENELLPPVVKHIFIPTHAMSHKSLPRFPRKNFKAGPRLKIVRQFGLLSFKILFIQDRKPLVSTLILEVSSS